MPLALEVEVATIRLRFGGGHGCRRRIGLQYRKSLANQLVPRYARNSTASPPLLSSLYLSVYPSFSSSVSLTIQHYACSFYPSMIAHSVYRYTCDRIGRDRWKPRGMVNRKDEILLTSGCRRTVVMHRLQAEHRPLLRRNRQIHSAVLCYAPLNGPVDIRSECFHDLRSLCPLLICFLCIASLVRCLRYQPRDTLRN